MLLSGNWRLDRFLVAVHLVGAAVLVVALLGDGISLTAEALQLGLYAAAAAPFLVNLGRNVFLSPTFPFLIASAMLAGPGEAVLTAIAASVSLAVARRKRMPTYKIMFNLAANMISAMVTAILYRALGGDPAHLGSQASVQAFLGAVCGYYLVNTFLVAIAAGLEQDLPIGRLWVQKFHWAALSYLAGGSAGLLILLFMHRWGPYGFVLVFPFLAIIYQSWAVSAAAARKAEIR
jgi:hypothetical protein